MTTKNKETNNETKEETKESLAYPIAPVFYDSNESADVEKVKNENPTVKIAPMWYNKGIISGTVGSVKFTIFLNHNKEKETQPDYHLCIASSYVKDLGNGEKQYSKQYQICGMWTQTDRDDYLTGSHKDMPNEYLLLRNQDKKREGHLPDYFLYVRDKIFQKGH